ncbi:FKBP_C domain-containing protein [Cephalotus follicularis]|uniref:peptidylprolyl isomerase n=1 Tax=Cephalotus follicularis TaxID=3775 RepID=A0A1Q3DFX3_CEPFO|nr:FKBP_C domain-containing protein [Cephalotus follicularis]
MAFWGIEVKPGRPFTYSTANDAKGRLRVSQATLGIGTATNKSILQCNVGDRSSVFLCSLLPDKVDSCPLNLEFDELEEVLFSVIGPRSVHLTGYYPRSGQHHNLHDESELNGEDIGETETKNSASDSEDDRYEDSFINDSDPEVSPSLVSDKETEKKKSKNQKRRGGRLKKTNQVIESDDNSTPQQQMSAEHHAGLVVVDSGSEDKLPISSLSKSIATTKNTNLETEERAEKEVAETVHYGNEDNGYSVSITESTKLQEKNTEGVAGDSGNNDLKKGACETGNNKTKDEGNSVIISDSTDLQVERNVEKEAGDRGNIEIKDVENCVDASERKFGANQVIESDNSTPQQQMSADHHSGLVVVDSGSEDKLPISSLFKCIATTKNTNLETEERAEKEVAETVHYGNEDNGYSVSISESTKLQEKNAEGEASDSGNNDLKKGDCETGNNKTKDEGNSVIISDSTDLQVKRNVEKEAGDRGNIEIKDVDNCVDAFERKFGAIVDGEGNSKGGQAHSLLHPTTHVGPENTVKRKRKRKERVKDRILNTSVTRATEANKHEGNSDCLGQNEPIVDDQKQKHTNIKNLENVQLFADGIQSEEKKKGSKRSKKQENGEATITENSLLSTKEKNSSVFNIEKDNIPVVNSSQRRTLSNELVIEELETGKLDGKIATLGKKISVKYIGMLKENGQVFDSSDGGPPFKFRLGSEGVLKGWSLGLEGMRVGGKRRLIIPPLLGYGNEGDGEKVPPGSYLVYDIELIKVR